MQYVHSQPNHVFETVGNYYAEPVVERHPVRHNLAMWTGGMLTGAALAVAGVMTMNAYERAMQPGVTPTEPTVRQVQSAETTDTGSFSVGAQVLKVESNQ